jgi:hypothetical protein
MALDYLLEALKKKDRKSKIAMPCTSEVEKLPKPGFGSQETKDAMSDPKRIGRNIDEKTSRSLSVAT